MDHRDLIEAAFNAHADALEALARLERALHGLSRHSPVEAAEEDAPQEGSEIDTAGIARLLGVSRRHATDRITKRADFPKPVINVSRKQRRWLTSDVRAWAAGKGVRIGGLGAGRGDCVQVASRLCRKQS